MFYIEYRVHHYDDGAVEYFNLNGQRHRVNGPAVEWADGTKFWYFEGQLHRVDGPAVEWADDTKEWWFEDQRLTEAQFIEKTVPKPSCNGKTVVIDGITYKLIIAN